jgi:hypothetical protein
VSPRVAFLLGLCLVGDPVGAGPASHIELEPLRVVLYREGAPAVSGRLLYLSGDTLALRRGNGVTVVGLPSLQRIRSLEGAGPLPSVLTVFLGLHCAANALLVHDDDHPASLLGGNSPALWALSGGVLLGLGAMLQSEVSAGLDETLEMPAPTERSRQGAAAIARRFGRGGNWTRWRLAVVEGFVDAQAQPEFVARSGWPEDRKGGHWRSLQLLRRAEMLRAVGRGWEIGVTHAWLGEPTRHQSIHSWSGPWGSQERSFDARGGFALVRWFPGGRFAFIGAGVGAARLKYRFTYYDSDCCSVERRLRRDCPCGLLSGGLVLRPRGGLTLGVVVDHAFGPSYRIEGIPEANVDAYSVGIGSTCIGLLLGIVF